MRLFTLPSPLFTDLLQVTLYNVFSYRAIFHRVNLGGAMATIRVNTREDTYELS